ncbi:MAG: sigma-54-dependent Fis family transcriptional regulator [Planctomycetes bacterium]|nr:sigma-54-dependent Fis family transcriptional regulator [Planctomycetota bacterium]
MPVTLVHRPKGVPAERLLLIGGFDAELSAALRKTNWLVEELLDGREALESASQREYGVVLCSLRMDGTWGLDVMEAVLRADPLTPVVISTHERNPRVVVEAMQRGAFDYVNEPYVDLPGVLRVLDRAVQRRVALRQGREWRAALAGDGVRFFGDLVGRSEAFRELCEKVRQVAPNRSPVLVEGESGVGKEGVARALHEASERRYGPFVAVHCGAIPESLLESELFGHEKGAFTGADATRVGVFEAASGGTLFLDEIGLTSPACQGKLLRVLENGVIRRVGASREFQVDVRVVSATNEPLDELVAQKRFRADLFYRLNVVTLKAPPLRERKEDIALLAYHFAQRFADESGKPFEAISPPALEALQAHAYPGNVRELRNLVERAVVFARGPVIRTTDLPEALRTSAPREAPGSEAEPAPSAASRAQRAHLLGARGAGGLDERLAAVEQSLLEQALAQAGGNRSHAARLLDIRRTNLLQKLRRYGLDGGKPKRAKPKRAQPSAAKRKTKPKPKPKPKKRTR